MSVKGSWLPFSQPWEKGTGNDAPPPLPDLGEEGWGGEGQIVAQQVSRVKEHVPPQEKDLRLLTYPM